MKSWNLCLTKYKNLFRLKMSVERNSKIFEVNGMLFTTMAHPINYENPERSGNLQKTSGYVCSGGKLHAFEKG